VIGLLTAHDGEPLSVEVFEGSPLNMMVSSLI
jgi:hypothetical protein